MKRRKRPFVGGDFAELAQRHSDAPSRVVGGDLGQARAEQLPEGQRDAWLALGDMAAHLAELENESKDLGVDERIVLTDGGHGLVALLVEHIFAEARRPLGIPFPPAVSTGSASA